MKKKANKAEGKMALTAIERAMLNCLNPGESITLRGRLITCHASHPCQSGENCTHCALYHVKCQGVACMAGIPCSNTKGVEVVRRQDVFFTINF